MSRWLGMMARVRGLVSRRSAEARMAEDMRNQRRVPIIEDLWTDARFAMRSLRRRPSLALVITTTFALGIGASTAMFSVLNGIALRELPVRNARDVAVLWTASPQQATQHWPLSYAELTSYRASTRAFADVAGVAFQGAVDVVMRDGPRAVPLAATWVTGNYFALLGVSPIAGRMIASTDDAPGAEPVMVISDAFWAMHFTRSPSAIGHTLLWQGKRFAIVGVLPRGLQYPSGAQAWVPVLTAFPATADLAAHGPDAMVFDAVGRVRDDIQMETASADFDAFLRASDAGRPAANRGKRAVLVSLPDRIVGDVGPILLAASVIVMLLLLLACINVANLLLIRGSARQPELAIRVALGAGRPRLVRLLLTETMLLAAAGGVLGVGLAFVAMHVLVALAPAELPQRELIAVDARVLTVSVLITTLAALVTGLVPAFTSTRVDAATWSRGGRDGIADSRASHRLRRALVTGQVVLTMLVVSGAGLVVRSLGALQSVPLGFDATQLHIVETTLATDSPIDHARQVLLQEAMIERVSAISGVVDATASPKPPFSGEGGWIATYNGEGQTVASYADNPSVNFEVVGPHYFRTLGIPLIGGRAFDARDRDDGAPVAIVSETVAQHTWPHTDAIGKRVALGPPTATPKWYTVVGVVRDTRYRDLATAQPTLYLPTSQFAGPVPMTLTVRTRMEIPTLMAQVRDALAAVDPALLVVSGGSMTERLATPLARPRFSAFLMSTFAAMALLLAIVGVYGAVATTVAERRRELGIRAALGASANDLRWLVLRQGLLPVALGCALGLGAALMSARLLRSVLYGISPTDPLTHTTVTLLVLVAAAAACWVPARRASRMDPVQALKQR